MTVYQQLTEFSYQENTMKQTSISSSVVDYFLIFIFIGAVPAIGVALSSLFEQGSNYLNIQPWMWQIFWCCTAVCIATGIYSNQWKHCLGLTLIFLSIGNVGIFSTAGEVSTSLDMTKIVKTIAAFLGLAGGVLIPIISALFGLVFAHEKWRRTRLNRA